MRALGLPGGTSIEDIMFLQQQQRQQDLQRDLQLRQMLLQEQLEQRGGLGLGSMMQEHQLRSMGDHPDLQQHYHTLLLNEQLQRNEERALLEAQAQMSYREELLMQQQQQAQHLQQDALVPQARAQVHAQEALSQPAAGALSPNPQQVVCAQPVSSNVAMLRDLAADSLAGNAIMKTNLERKKPAVMDPDANAASAEEQAPPSAKLPAKEPKSKSKKSKTKHSPKSKTKTNAKLGRSPASHLKILKEGKRSSKKAPSLMPKSTPQANSVFSPHSVLTPGLLSGSISSYRGSPTSHGSPILNPVILDAAMREHMIYEASPRLGTLECLLAAANADDKEENALNALRNFKACDILESELESDATMEEPTLATLRKGEYVKLSNGFSSELPRLPQEPLYEGPVAPVENDDMDDDILSETPQHFGMKDSPDKYSTGIAAREPKSKTRTVSNVLEYPYPIDVWWPSTPGIKRERRAAGEESDEDTFEEESSIAAKASPMKINLPKIRRRLAQDVKPGVLEKLPHCKLHRLLMRRKKNLPVPDLVYCWQVSDIYPNDTMVCCSKCGTWRHAACGGHHEAFSVRENTKAPFTATCDRCHEEEKILQDYPNAQKRLERQRMEQIRRGLSTSAVMRHASFAKHGGTYKWPLGRVSATHLTGHTRSVHARHDKAEKQWSDMVTRLGSGYGHRPRERARVRTKELERLLVSVEDAGMPSFLLMLLDIHFSLSTV